MCGIAAAIWSGNSHRESAEDFLRRASTRMQCRGPDGAGTWFAPAGLAGLAHRRLAIIDLTATGSQPMVSDDGVVAITFNGEIYNYKAIRNRLEVKGHRFRSQSDTEVLLRLYEEKGDDLVSELRGMFAFALWDGRKRALLLARDPFGIKPLYYAEVAGGLRAASEVKALLAGGQVDTSPAAAGHVGFFLWGHVPEPYTFYRGIRALPAGCTMWVEHNGARTVRRFADIRDALCEENQAPEVTSPREAQAFVREKVLDSVRHHLVADVNVGMFLSAGLDSATLTALASEIGGRLRTVTLGFEEYRGTPLDETPLAEEIAKRYGTDHQTVWITKADFFRELNRFIDRMDQPTVDAVNTFFVARAAAETGLKVAMSGLGGDELFGGYPSFTQIPRLVSLVEHFPASRRVGRGLRMLAAPVLGYFTSPKYAALIEYGGGFAGAYLLRRGMFLPWEIFKILDADLVAEGLRELEPLARLEQSTAGISAHRLKISSLEASWYMRNQLLRDTDWASMSHSLEVRVPFVDWELWRQLAPVLRSHPGLGKRAMGMTPRIALPASILHRPKTGFVVPTSRWLSEGQMGRPSERGSRGWAREIYRMAA